MDAGCSPAACRHVDRRERSFEIRVGALWDNGEPSTLSKGTRPPDDRRIRPVRWLCNRIARTKTALERRRQSPWHLRGLSAGSSHRNSREVTDSHAAEDGAALWNVAHFATSPVEPTPLAASFTPAESVNAIKARLGGSSKPAGDAPPAPARSRRASTPANHHADWIVVEVGKVDRSKLSTDMQRWLSQAKRTETLDAQPPVAEAPRPPAEYKFRGASRDGRRTVYVSEGDKTVILCDVEGQVLRSWKGRVDSGTAAISPSGNDVVIARHVRGAESRWLEATLRCGLAFRSVIQKRRQVVPEPTRRPERKDDPIWVAGARSSCATTRRRKIGS